MLTVNLLCSERLVLVCPQLFSLKAGLTGCFIFGGFYNVFTVFVLWQEKCAQYWPTAEEREMSLRDTRFLVTLLSEDTKSYYTTRVLELQNINVRPQVPQYQGESTKGERKRLKDVKPSHHTCLVSCCSFQICVTCLPGWFMLWVYEKT